MSAGLLRSIPANHPSRLQGSSHVPVNLIRVGKRVRTALGDIEALATSISDLGLQMMGQLL